MKLQDYIHYYIGCQCQTPDGVGVLVGLPWRIMAQDRVTVHFGKQLIKTLNSLDGPIKVRNHGDYALKATRYEPIGAEGVTEDGFDMPGGVKPILNRLEDMTEDNFIDLLQCMVPDEMDDKPINDEYGMNLFHNDGGNLVNSDVIVGAEFSCRCMEGQISIKKCGTICLYDEEGAEMELNNGARAYHYLLQQGFDLFGLIDAGFAIDAKTVK